MGLPMKTLYLMVFLLLAKFAAAQSLAVPVAVDSKQLLSADADLIVQANKFLDFKGRDTLVKIVAGETYEKTGLRNYFGYPKNWSEIENETAASYKKNEDRYAYTFQGDTMTETYSKYGSYDIRRDIEMLYNAQGFVIKQVEKVFVGKDWLETKTINSEFDPENRVVKIKKTTDRKRKEEQVSEIIEAVYKEDAIVVTSKHGTMICAFITDKNAVGFVSDLSPRNTASYFMYALARGRLDRAKEYCTAEVAEQLNDTVNLNDRITEVQFIEGIEKKSDNYVTIRDTWAITSATNSKQKFKIDFVLVKQRNGWKIDGFKLAK